ncbi:hypothetical protein [Streptomyces sp. NPDC048606]|uniref:hypothetical protein n=1 Tax=Streptomyces sp. NPDC048606 TaxID=3154726 RepID=UPI003415A6F8
MTSHQVLVRRNSSATLRPDRLSIEQERGRVRVEIPLAAIQEAARDGETSIRIVLTDGELRSIQGGNPNATEAFLTALNTALPEERDPAGSALVTTEEDSSTFKRWHLLVGGGAVLLAYVGYVSWVGGTYGIPHAFITTVSILGALFGLLFAGAFVGSFLDRVTLARRGITVVAARGRYPNGKRHGYFTYTDPSGNEYHHFSGRSSPTLHLVYDPQRPGANAVRQTFAWMTVKHVLGLALALGIAWLGVLGIAAPFH